MSTFILPVIEIEQVIQKLIVLRDKTVATSQFPTTKPSAQPNEYTKIDAMISNWNTILTTYRSQTGDLTYAFTNELTQYNDMVNSFYNYQHTQNTVAVAGLSAQAAMQGIVYIIGISLSGLGFTKYGNPAFYGEMTLKAIQAVIFTALQSTLHDYCSDMDIRNQYQFDSYNTHICQDFSNSKWQYFTNFFKDVCSMQTGFDSASDLSTFYGNLCLNGSPVDPSTIPGGVESSGIDQTLFQFLQSNKAYLTFGAQLSTSLMWTSSVTSSLTHTTTFTNNHDNEIDLTGVTVMQLGVEDESSYAVKIGSTYNIAVGQTSTRTESTQRTVVINFGDADQGTTFK